MKKLNNFIVFILITAFCLSLCGCKSKYNSVDCESPFTYPAEIANYYYKPDYEAFNNDKKIEESGLAFYYESGLSGRKIDNAVDAVKRVQTFCDIPQPIFLTEKSITFLGDDGLWVNCDDSAELIGAVILESTNKNELPFGFFAGVSAHFLNDSPDFAIYDGDKLQKSLKEYPYVSELQYPLFTTRNTSKNERNTAWNFALNIGKTWLNNHSVEDIKELTTADLQGIFEQFEVKLPHYRFSVGDYFYPVQMSTENLNYYFAHDYKDSELTEDYFSFEYPVLTKFLNENEVLVSEMTGHYGLNGFPEPVDCFFGTADVFKQYSSGRSDPRHNTISCYTVTVFGHEIMHWVQYHTDYSFCGKLDEVVHTVLNLKYSSFAAGSYYRDYKHEYKNRYLGGMYDDEAKSALKFATNTYNKVFGKCSYLEFDLDSFIDAIAYYYVQQTEEIHHINMIMAVSLLSYVYDAYGIDVMMQVNKFTAPVEGKPIREFIIEWSSLLKSKFK